MKFVFFFFLGFFLFSCNKKTQKQPTDLPFLPNEATLIFKVNDPSKAASLLQNNSLLQQNSKNQLYTFFNDLEFLKLIKATSTKFYICFSPLGKNDFGFTLIAQTNKTSLTTTDFDKHFISDKTYNDFLYKEFKIKNQSIYATQFNNTWVLSNNNLLMENHIKQFENAIPYKYSKAFTSLNNEPISLVIVNSEISDICERLFPNLPKKHLLQKSYSGWTAGDFSIDKNTIDFNAIYKPQNDEDFSAIFKDITPQNNTIATITPVNAKQFTSYTFENYETLAKNLASYNRTPVKTEGEITNFLNETSEFGTIQFSKHNFFVCRIPNESIEMSTYFNFEDKPLQYRDVPIYKLNKIIDFSKNLKPLIEKKEYQFFIQFEEFIIFATSTNGLRELIPSLKNENTLYKKEWYQKFSEQLTEQSTFLIVANTEYANDKLKSSFTAKKQKNWNKTLFKNYKAVAFQTVSEENFSHLHLVTSKTIIKQKDFKVNETENVILSNNLKTNPQFVTNYISKTKDVIVQDEKNQLIVISNKGEIKWKKPIDEPILGEVKQMDMYRNGRLQYVFTTPTKLYVIDRNGKEVPPFPLSQKQTITQAVALFDYDSNRKYRIVITQDTKLTMFDNKGKQVKGFKFKNKTDGIISHPPKHIRVGTKDYIVVNESNNGVHFLNRTGKERIKLKQTPNKTTQEWFWYKNAFSTLDITNSITQVNTVGTITNIQPKLTIPNAVSTSTTKTWVSFAENSLSIKNKIIELEFGKYTHPKIFYINNKIYVSITNMDTKKVYLFDSNAKTISGFPVYGTGEASVDNSDKDANLELIVKGDDNSILFYDFR